MTSVAYGVTSKVEICRLALDHLLQRNTQSVISIDKATNEVEAICARWYDTSRRSILRRHTWNFATKRAVLTKDGSTTIAFGFSNAYNLPNDLLSISVLAPRSDAFENEILHPEEYAVENGQILTDFRNGGDIYLKYIYDFQTVVKMDSTFITALAFELAVNMSYAFTGNDALVSRLVAQRDREIAQAMSADGQERTPVRIRRNDTFFARRRRGYFYNGRPLETRIF